MIIELVSISIVVCARHQHASRGSRGLPPQLSTTVPAQATAAEAAADTGHQDNEQHAEHETYPDSQSKIHQLE